MSHVGNWSGLGPGLVLGLAQSIDTLSFRLNKNVWHMSNKPGSGSGLAFGSGLGFLRSIICNACKQLVMFMFMVMVMVMVRASATRYTIIV